MRAIRALALAFLTLGPGGCALPSFLVTPVQNPAGLEEQIVRDGGRDKIAVIPIEGLIVNARTGGGVLGGAENDVSLLAEQLAKAADDRRVRAVVLRINSPGGAVAASDTMFGLVRDFRESTGKPVVASVQEVGASGGYYVALAADEIYAQPTSVVGSVGVLIQTFDASGTLDLLGLRARTLTSGPLKDLASPLDPLDEGEIEILQGLVDDFYARFLGRLDERQPLSPDVRPMATDGRVFSGARAAEIGLVDATGVLSDALGRAAELAEIDGPRAVIYTRPYGYTGSIYAAADVPPAQGRLPGIALPAELRPLPAGFYYLWRP